MKTIGLAQINTIAGNIEYNSKKIANYIKQANEQKLDLIVFPEYALTGISIENVLERHPIVFEDSFKWLNGIAKITKDTVAIVGLIDKKPGKSQYCSALAILQHGKILEIIKPDNKNILSRFNNIGIILGENYKNTEKELNHESNKNISILINCTASTYSSQNELLKYENLSFISEKYKIPCIYVNQVGATDNIPLNGSSFICYNGKLIAKADCFEEQLLITNLNKDTSQTAQSQTEKDYCISKDSFSLNYSDKEIERAYKTAILGIKDYFEKNKFKRAVLGLSGGLDSTVCAVLLADAIGKENVLGVSMPSKITSQESKTDAKQLAENLGIKFAEIPIKTIVDTINNDFSALFQDIEDKWQERYTKTFTMDNIQARTRATILWGITNEFASCIPIATSDKSEAYMGYATINGDMSGGYAPIADITKTKLFALAKWMNKNRNFKNAIPQSVILKKPGAELAINPKTGKPLIAEDALMPYEFLDEIIWRIENKHENYQKMLHDVFIYEKEHQISKEQKTEWLDKFYRRMSTALYKWSILPPSIITDTNTINKSTYFQPITSGSINYKGADEEYINKAL